MKKAKYAVSISQEKEVQCLLCPHVCRIPSGHKGLCRVRYNNEGNLELLNYGLVTAASLDPIEKKPLKRFYPGKSIFSIGSFGCNLFCGFCQNWRIAHGQEPENQYFSPEDAVKKAIELVPYENIGIAYTYSEPLMWYEYILDTAKLVKEAKLKNVLVTNGYINPKPLKELLPYIDAVNLDIKAFGEGFYHDVCGGKLAPVLKNAVLFANNCHLEITTLLIPGLNDSNEEIEKLAASIAAIDKKTPLHLTRYFPNYKFTMPSTPIEVMYKAKEIADKYLTDVFLGNL